MENGILGDYKREKQCYETGVQTASLPPRRSERRHLYVFAYTIEKRVDKR